MTTCFVLAHNKEPTVLYKSKFFKNTVKPVFTTTFKQCPPIKNHWHPESNQSSYKPIMFGTAI